MLVDRVFAIEVSRAIGDIGSFGSIPALLVSANGAAKQEREEAMGAIADPMSAFFTSRTKK